MNPTTKKFIKSIDTKIRYHADKMEELMETKLLLIEKLTKEQSVKIKVMTEKPVKEKPVVKK